MAKKNNTQPGADVRPEKTGSKVNRSIANPVRNLIVTTVVSILLGLAFFLKPYEVTQYLGYGAGGLLALVGLIYIVIYFFRTPISGVYRSEFVIGLVMLLAGLYLALSGITRTTSSGYGGYNTTTTATTAGYILLIRVIGILIIADGLLKLQYAVDIGRMRFRPWWIVLILAVIGIAIGVATAMNFVKTQSYGNMNTTTNAPDSFIYYLGGQLKLGSNNPTYARNITFYGGMLGLGLGFILNGILDLVALIIIAIRNQRAARADAIAEASAMMAFAKKGEVALPPEEPSGEPSGEPPVEEVVIPAEPEPAPTPAPVEAPSAEPVIAPDPALEQPPMAAPMDE